MSHAIREHGRISGCLAARATGTPFDRDMACAHQHLEFFANAWHR
jgi:hypothetical protein